MFDVIVNDTSLLTKLIRVQKVKLVIMVKREIEVPPVSRVDVALPDSQEVQVDQDLKVPRDNVDYK